MQGAAKVGVLVVIFAVLLIGAYAVLGKSLFSPPTDTYYATFADASGISASAPVVMAGVKIGSVSKVELDGSRAAKVTFLVQRGIRLPAGSTALIPTPLIGLGDTSLSIKPPEVASGDLTPGATLAGVKAGALDNIIPDSKATMQELNKTLVAVRKLLEDQDLKQNVSKLLVTSQTTLAKMGDLAGNANQLLAENRAAVGDALRSANVALQDVHRVTSQVASLLADGKLKGDLTGVVSDLKKITNKTDSLLASVNGLVGDPKFKESITSSAANVAQITDTGKEIAENTRQITEQGVEISKNAKVVSEKAVPLMDHANQVMTKAADIEDQLKDVLDHVGGFFNRKAGPGFLSNLTVEMDLMRESQPGYWRTDIDLSYPVPMGTVYGGLYDAFGSNKLTLELGQPLTSKLQYRYGIYAGKPAAGVDYQLAPKLALRGDMWDINRLRMDLRARYDFGNGIVGWVGVDSLFDRDAATIGIGIRK